VASSPAVPEVPRQIEELPEVSEVHAGDVGERATEASSTESSELPVEAPDEGLGAPGSTPDTSDQEEEAAPVASAEEAPSSPEPPDLSVSTPEIPAPVEPEPTRGGTELETGTSVIASLQPFLEATGAGLPGICVVRESPERIAAQVGARPVDIYWLSNLGRGRTLKPNDLPAISDFLSHHLNEGKVTVFFLEGIEYLVRIHGVDAIVDLLLGFDRAARDQEARVWVHLTPDLLKPADLERIRTAFPRSAGFG